MSKKSKLTKAQKAEIVKPISSVATHPLIQSVAFEMAAEMYEQLARTDAEFRKTWPDQKEWAQLSWGLYVESARSTLARLLQTNADEQLKSQIYEAILADNSVRHGRGVQVALN